MGAVPSFDIEGVPDEDREAVLGGDMSMKAIAQRIQNGSISKVVVLMGAGASTSAGIPDFRSPGTGLYANLEKYRLNEPQDIFDISFFDSNPRPFFRLARELLPGRFDPTPTHHFLRLLDDKGLLQRVYTQNIDTLERQAGIPGERIVECHGSFASATCRGCNASFAADASGAPKVVADPIRSWEGEDYADHGDVLPAYVPRCSRCGDGVVKPDIVFFGEQLPDRYRTLSPGDASAADLLVVIGTSLEVGPVNMLPTMVRPTCPRLLINREPVGLCADAEAEWKRLKKGRRDAAAAAGKEPAPEDLDSEDEDEGWMDPMSEAGFRFYLEDNYRDVFSKGDCDDGVWQLAGLLGWEAELAGMVGCEVPPVAAATTPVQAQAAPAAATPATAAAAAGGSSAAASPLRQADDDALERSAEEVPQRVAWEQAGAGGAVTVEEALGTAVTEVTRAAVRERMRRTGMSVEEEALRSLGELSLGEQEGKEEQEG